MKRMSFLSLLLCFCLVFGAFTALPLQAGGEEESEEEGVSVYHASTIKDIRLAYGAHPYDGANIRIVLDNDIHVTDDDLYTSHTKEYAAGFIINVFGVNSVIDFNGHTMTYDQSPAEELAVKGRKANREASYFLRFVVRPVNDETGCTITFTDSVGGGGVVMNSNLKSDTQVAALVVENCTHYSVGTGVEKRIKYTLNRLNSAVFEDGNYVINCRTREHGDGTASKNNYYRGAVITDYLNVKVNGGVFIARGDGKYCTRELTAFGTSSKPVTDGKTVKSREGEVKGLLKINGGVFISDGYALHHFDPGDRDSDGNGIVNTVNAMEYPTICGGYFKGSIGYLGLTYVYSTGINPYRGQDAWSTFGFFHTSPVTGGSLSFEGVYKSGNPVHDPYLMKLADCQNLDTLIVMGDHLFRMEPTRSLIGHTLSYVEEVTNLTKLTFGLNYTIAPYLTDILYYGLVPAAARPFVSVEYNGQTTTYYTDEREVNFAGYSGKVTVRVGLETRVFNDAVRILQIPYYFNVSESNGPAVITTQPEGVTVEPGTYAAAAVEAEDCASYLWQIRPNGMPWLSLNDSTISLLNSAGLEVRGAETSVLSLKSDGAAAVDVRCKLTGTDGSSVTSSGARLYWGGFPKIRAFTGGEYLEGEDARFLLTGDYFKSVTFTVDRGAHYGASERFITLEKFKEITGLSYTLRTGANYCLLTIHNPPAEISGKYKFACTAIENSIGKSNYDPLNSLPLALKTVVPEIVNEPGDASFNAGGSLDLYFSAENMTAASWTFEILREEDEIAVSYDLDGMRALFPQTVFTASEDGEGNAALHIENAPAALADYTVYGMALGNGASAFTVGVTLSVGGALTYKTGDLNRDGAVDIQDVTVLLDSLSGSTVSVDEAEADLNDSGSCDISDVTALLDLLSGK